MPKIEVGLHEGRRRSLRAEWAVENQQGEPILLLRPVDYRYGEVFQAISTEITGRNIGMIVWRRLPIFPEANFHTIDTVAAIAVLISGDSIFRIVCQPALQNLLLLAG
jgi:hypothetical protein